MKILCVIDMQNDFIDGSLGTKEAEAILQNVKQKIELYKKNGDAVIFTRDTHPQDYLQTSEGKKLPVEHCIINTHGWQISDILPIDGAKIIDKPTFGSTQLAHYIATLQNVEAIELIGLCTDICVISNTLLLKASFPECPISVDSSCCAGVTPESHLRALECMKMCQIDVN